MDKLKMQTANKADENFKKLAAMFPNAVTETIDENGEVVRAIDKDVLMQEINTRVVEGKEERYQFTWPDKKKSVLLANAPINKTLRPCKEESVDFDNTENLYIEGDNLEVLKLLQETYLGKIKMIYIDPPYNTGNDFVYNDDFSVESGVWKVESGDFDEEGNRLVKNLDSNGRFHTDWLNMIYPRLKLAKDLLTNDGVIFISIDDNEVENLKKICNEIFGEQNYITEIAWQCLDTIKNDAKYFSDNHEYILVYSKSINDVAIQGVKKGEKQRSYYKNYDNDPRGDYLLTPLHAKSGTESGIYSYTFSNGQTWTPPQGTYPRFSKNTLKSLDEDNRIYLDPNRIKTPQKKTFLSEVGDRMPPVSFWDYASFGSTRQSNKELSELIDKGMFQNPKPVKTILTLIDLIANNCDSIVLDFFSGSATTAHAVMQLNAEDGGHRKFIMVQLPEEADEKSEAYKAGYKNICEIGKERIRRAGNKILEEATQETVDIAKYGESYEVDETMNKYKNLDVGFRVLKCDSSNMKDVYYSPNDYDFNTIDDYVSNIKEDRTPEDLLFQVMLDLGILLSSKITMHNAQCIIHNEKRTYSYYDVADGYLIACFDEDVNEEVITEIAKKKPYYFVMRDSSMANDSVATNFDQIFATYSPETTRKVL